MRYLERPSVLSNGQEVSEWSGDKREHAVQNMFTAIARFYDLNNSLLSFGLHHRWKRIAAAFSGLPTDGLALDLGAGTGDLAILLSQQIERSGHIVALDLNAAMLKQGLRKITAKKRSDRIQCLLGNGEELTFRDGSFDAVTAGFCIRNVGNLLQVITEIKRVLKPGGRFVCLEFSRPVATWFRCLYDWYSFHLLPWIGTYVSRDGTGVYQYLPASIRTFPDQEQLCALFRQTGFQQVTYHNLNGGIVAIHIAVK